MTVELVQSCDNREGMIVDVIKRGTIAHQRRDQFLGSENMSCGHWSRLR